MGYRSPPLVEPVKTCVILPADLYRRSKRAAGRRQLSFQGWLRDVMTAAVTEEEELADAG